MSTHWKRRLGKYFYNWLYSLKGWGDLATNNYGYAPLDDWVANSKLQDPYQCQLYFLFAKVLRRPIWMANATTLEVGCGRGGGLMFLKKGMVLDGEVTGVDYSRHAVRFANAKARNVEGLSFLRADATRLPFEDGKFDLVLNVESSHIYQDPAAFFHEVARVLRKPGLFLLADYRKKGQPMEDLKTQLQQSGFSIRSIFDITPNVVMACKADSARREALLVKAPRYIRGYMREYCMLEGSGELNAFEEEYVYFLIICYPKVKDKN